MISCTVDHEECQKWPKANDEQARRRLETASLSINGFLKINAHNKSNRIILRILTEIDLEGMSERLCNIRLVYTKAFLNKTRIVQSLFEQMQINL